MLKDFLEMESSQVITMHIQSVDQNKAIKTILLLIIYSLTQRGGSLCQHRKPSPVLMKYTKNFSPLPTVYTVKIFKNARGRHPNGQDDL